MGINIYSETFEVIYYAVLKEARKFLPLEHQKKHTETSFLNWDFVIDDKRLMTLVFGDDAPTNSQYWANRLSAHRKPLNQNGEYNDEFLNENSDFMIRAFNLIKYQIPDEINEFVNNKDLEAKILYQFFLIEKFNALFKRNVDRLLVYDEQNKCLIQNNFQKNNGNKKSDKLIDDNQASNLKLNILKKAEDRDLNISVNLKAFIVEYYDLIAEKKYKEAWSLLTQNAQMELFSSSLGKFKDENNDLISIDSFSVFNLIQSDIKDQACLGLRQPDCCYYATVYLETTKQLIEEIDRTTLLLVKNNSNAENLRKIVPYIAMKYGVGFNLEHFFDNYDDTDFDYFEQNPSFTKSLTSRLLVERTNVEEKHMNKLLSKIEDYFFQKCGAKLYDLSCKFEDYKVPVIKLYKLECVKRNDDWFINNIQPLKTN